MYRTELRWGLGRAELDSIVETQNTVYAPVQIRRVEADGAVLVRSTSPSGLLQYFWLDGRLICVANPPALTPT